MLKQVRVADIKSNPDNPRTIRGEKFSKLVKSIQEFPEMLEARPIVVNQDMVVLGGNMRLKAIKEANIKEVTVDIVDWDAAKQAEFIIKDNVGFGDWDWDLLANDWDSNELSDWGLDVWKEPEADIEEVKPEQQTSEAVNRIVLEYSEEDYAKVIRAFNRLGGTKESAIFKLLDLE